MKEVDRKMQVTNDDLDEMRNNTSKIQKQREEC